MKNKFLFRKLVEGVMGTRSLAIGKKIEDDKIPLDNVVDMVSQWAKSGDNTDKCLKKGFLPVPVHFYQPIPNVDDLEKRKTWEKVSALNGIKFEPDRYLEFIKLLGKKYNKECCWPNNPTNNPNDFYLNNSCFSYGCASMLHSIIREFKPKNIIEVGSGNSSKIIRDAIAINENENNEECMYTIIDPYSSLDKSNFSENTTIINEKVEEINVDFFRRLKEDDILFIDSSHVCKIGSDVNFEILEVLPILSKGVIIHFHDIHLPYEYPKVYATNSRCRMFWTEAYLLQGFLSCNSSFEIILPVNYVQREFEEEFRKYFSNSNVVENFESGSFWIKKIK